jgi:perosamine synthetase
MTVRSRIGLVGYLVGEDEVTAISQVLSSGILTNGPRTVAFEQQFAKMHQVDHAVAFANGTVALTAIYLALGIGPGDEVIVPSMTFVSSATSVLHVGASPVFAEVDPETFNLDPVDARRRLSSRTRAILAVHYGGQPADLDELRGLAQDAGAFLIEDAAEAHGATYRGRSVGSLGIAAMFSFTPTKNITTGEGGMVTTNDGSLAEKLRLLRNHGQTAPYYHASLGYNWRLTEMQAAMGEVQLTRLDGILATKRANAAWMQDRLRQAPGIKTPLVRPDRTHAFMLYTLLLDADRDAVMRAFAVAGIESKLYFPPVHQQPVFAARKQCLPITEEISRRMLSIPFHARLGTEELEYVASVLEATVGR